MSPKSLNILYEDEYILVCVKPPGVATQSKNIKTPDMTSILKNHISQNTSSENISREPYLAVIHRLDQPVQGIMVFAKNRFAARELSRELQTNEFGKYYRALVSGSPPKPSDTLEDYIQKDGKSNISRICKKEAAGAKLAKLSYKIVPKEQQYFSLPPIVPSNISDFTELDIHLHTGRHHQIRVQLSHIGCPIIGDTKYNSENIEKTNWQKLDLCSYRLEFTHPKDKSPMSFSLI